MRYEMAVFEVANDSLSYGEAKVNLTIIVVRLRPSEVVNVKDLYVRIRTVGLGRIDDIAAKEAGDVFLKVDNIHFVLYTSIVRIQEMNTNFDSIKGIDGVTEGVMRPNNVMEKDATVEGIFDICGILDLTIHNIIVDGV